MSRLYSDSFFHYTKEFTALQLIIKQGFKVSLAKEQFATSTEQLANDYPQQASSLFNLIQEVETKAK